MFFGQGLSVPLTLDKGFWRIALQRRYPLKQSGVALFRVHPVTPENLAPLVRAFVEATMPWAAHVSIITGHGIQMLPARKI